MLNTKFLVPSYKDVPETWIYEYYCKLSERLDGQLVTLLSVFNSGEKTPSMKIFMNEEDRYFFKCFSTGKGGSAIKLVMELYHLEFPEACERVKQDYITYLKNGGVAACGYDTAMTRKSGYKVQSFIERGWTHNDREFWTPYNIGSRLLEAYNVRPLESFVMQKEESSFTVARSKLYGYFKKDGSLYKIYQPGCDKKFINVSSVVQGLEQLQGHNYLLIGSSMKDILSVKSFNLRVDLVAPDSENTMIPKHIMLDFIERYPYIGVMFDNDEAGIKAMKKYRELYGTLPILLQMKKDVSDSVESYGPSPVISRLVPLLNKIYDYKVAEVF